MKLYLPFITPPQSLRMVGIVVKEADFVMRLEDAPDVALTPGARTIKQIFTADGQEAAYDALVRLHWRNTANLAAAWSLMLSARSGKTYDIEPALAVLTLDGDLESLDTVGMKDGLDDNDARALAVDILEHCQEQHDIDPYDARAMLHFKILRAAKLKKSPSNPSDNVKGYGSPGDANLSQSFRRGILGLFGRAGVCIYASAGGEGEVNGDIDFHEARHAAANMRGKGFDGGDHPPEGLYWTFGVRPDGSKRDVPLLWDVRANSASGPNLGNQRQYADPELDAMLDGWASRP